MIVLIVNEFDDQGCPVTKMVFDMGDYLRQVHRFDVRQIFWGRKYRPGGIAVRRIMNLLALQIILPFRLVYYKILGLLRKEAVVLLSTTLPPLIHWNAIVSGRILRLKVLCWYQDAHPELEARILEKKRLPILAWGLRFFDRQILSHADGFIALDGGMKEFLKRLAPNVPVIAAAPWVTYATPSRRLSQPIGNESEVVRFLYAGNYGFAHDLGALVRRLESLDAAQLRKVHIAFVGMNEKAQNLIRSTFANYVHQIELLPRMKDFSELCNMMKKFDFGLVSLNHNYVGIACPSKAYTYLSQGLPILYVGPKGTLSYDLCLQGWGLDLETTDFFELLAKEHKIQLNWNQILPDPKDESRRCMGEFIASYG